MLNKLRLRLTYANVMSTIACFGVLAGGTAYAANTIGSADIINESILSVDIKNGEVKNADIAASAVTSAKLYDESVLNSDLGLNSVTSAKIYNGSVLNSDLGPNSVTSDKVAANALTGADINESSLAVVQGRGEFIANRRVLGVQGPTENAVPFLTIPGFGELVGDCKSDYSFTSFRNTSGGPVDFWSDFRSAGGWGEVIPAGGYATIGQTGGGSNRPGDGVLVGLGIGNDSGPRRVASLQVFNLQEAVNFPCGVQAVGTLWTSP